MTDFSLFHWIVVAVIAFVFFSLFGRRGGFDKMVCKACGHVGTTQMVTRGSLAIEIVLWLCFLIPGLIYSLWRSTSRHSACRKCASTEIIPADSPIGKKLIADQQPK